MPRLRSQKQTRPPRVADNVTTNSNLNSAILDGGVALRASPDGDANENVVPAVVKQNEDLSSALSDVPELEPPVKKNERDTVPKKTQKKAVADVDYNMPKQLATKAGKTTGGDPEAEGDEEVDEEVDEEEVKQAPSRPPPVNSDYLPLPWKGRLGYVCYLVL
jgi:UV DNA damage endonuclease